jgi:hypothetical protein
MVVWGLLQTVAYQDQKREWKLPWPWAYGYLQRGTAWLCILIALQGVCLPHAGMILLALLSFALPGCSRPTIILIVAWLVCCRITFRIDPSLWPPDWV